MATPALLAAAITATLLAASPKPAARVAAEPSPSGLVAPPDPVQVMGSCRARKGGCTDFAGVWAGGAAVARCKKLKGSWSAEACPADGLVASCTQRTMGGEDRMVVRSYKPVTAKSARAECARTARGVFLKK